MSDQEAMIRSLASAAKTLEAAETKVERSRNVRDSLVVTAAKAGLSDRMIAAAIGKERGLVYMIRKAARQS